MIQIPISKRLKAQVEVKSRCIVVTIKLIFGQRTKKGVILVKFC